MDASRAGGGGGRRRAPPGRQGAWPCLKVERLPRLRNENLAGRLCMPAAWCVGDTVGSSPSNATCGWVALGKSPDLSEPQLHVQGNRPKKTKCVCASQMPWEFLEA